MWALGVRDNNSERWILKQLGSTSREETGADSVGNREGNMVPWTRRGECSGLGGVIEVRWRPRRGSLRSLLLLPDEAASSTFAL